MRQLLCFNCGLLFAVAIGAACLPGRLASAQIVIDDFSAPWSQTGQYGWDLATNITDTPDTIIVNATNDGGYWVDLAAPIDGSSTPVLEITARLGASNTTTGFNAVLFDNNGTQAGFHFDTADLNAATFTTLTKDLLNPDFYNAGSIGTWTPSNLTVYHLQGSFSPYGAGIIANIEFDNLQLAVPEPATLAIVGLALLCGGSLWRRVR